jgi:hypothetical protein
MAEDPPKVVADAATPDENDHDLWSVGPDGELVKMEGEGPEFETDDSDDEELPESHPGLIAILGFGPREMDDPSFGEDDDDNEDDESA